MPIGTFSAIPTPETTIGLAKEVTRGTAVAPSFWLPVMNPAYKPDRTYLHDESLQGSMVKTYDVVPGLRYDAHGWDQLLYLDSFPMLVQANLGSPDTQTGAASSTTLMGNAAQGASSITTAGSIASGSFLVIDGGTALQETVYTTSAGGTSAISLLYPLAFAHSNGATVTGLYKHQFSLLNNSDSTGNQPASYTITDFGGETNWRQLTAAQLDGLNIQGSADALPKAQVNWFANPATTPSPPTASFTSAESPPGWTADLLLGGTQIPYLVSWELDLKRGVTPIPAITGTQNYWQYFASTLEATAKFTVLEDFNATWLTAYENGTTETIDFVVYDIKSGWAMYLHSSKAKITAGQLDRSKEWLEVPLELELLPTTTDALAGGVSPVLISFGNGVTASY